MSSLEQLPLGLALTAIYVLFILMTATALLLSRRLSTHKHSVLQPGLLSPLGSLYIFTTAFLLSNVIFQTNNLKTAVTQEVVTFSKLGAVLNVLPQQQSVEGRRLLFDYAYSITHDEAATMKKGLRSDTSQAAIDRLREFLSSSSAALPEAPAVTPESANYLRRASDFSFDLIDARERRLSLASSSNSPVLWLSIGVMYFMFAFLSFSVHRGASSLLWLTFILLFAFPVPAVMLFLYSNPLAAGLYDLASQFAPILARNM